MSHDYLSVLAASNSGDTSKPFRAQIDAELSRRTAQRATRIAIGSLSVAIVSLLISGAGLIHTIKQGSHQQSAVSLCRGICECGSLQRRVKLVHAGQHFLGEQPQAALGDIVGHGAKIRDDPDLLVGA